jgi:hypothetical protein
MTHFSVIVCLDDASKLEAALAPFDENLEVEEYRDYEKGEASEFWLYRSLKRTAKDFADGTGILPYKPDQLGWSSDSSKETPEVQRQKQAEDARLFHSLPDPIRWRDIVQFHNERYDDDSEPLHYDEATDQAYTLSTRNPDGKWDYWRIGGRWGGYFATTDFEAYAACAEWAPRRDWDSPKRDQAGWVDGGQKKHLDLNAMRLQKANRAHAEYDSWEKLTDGLPEAQPWRAFAERAEKEAADTEDVEEKRAAWNRARVEYGAQERVQAIKGSDIDSFTCRIGEFAKPRGLFVELARAQAVPGYALITVEGKWMAPGEMGWFGASTDREGDRIGYLEVANAYIESLADSAYLIAVDCHV